MKFNLLSYHPQLKGFSWQAGMYAGMKRVSEKIYGTRGQFAVLLAMIKAFCPTNIILDIIEKGIRRVSS